LIKFLMNYQEFLELLLRIKMVIIFVQIF